MPRRITYGPRYAMISYTVRPRGEHGCMVTGNLASVATQVACYRESRPEGTIDVTYSEHCAHCSGNGRIAGKRRLSWKPCKACGGQPALLEHPLSQDEIKTIMRRYQSAWLAP